MTPGCEAEAEAEAIYVFIKQFVDAEHSKVGLETPWRGQGRQGWEDWGLCAFKMDQGDLSASSETHLPREGRADCGPAPHAQNCFSRCWRP